MVEFYTIFFAVAANVFGYFVAQGAWRLGAAIFHKDTTTVVRLRGPVLKIALYFVAFAIVFVSHTHAIKTGIIFMMAAQGLQMFDDHCRAQGRGAETFANLRSLFSSV